MAGEIGYQTFSYRCENRGIQARYVQDDAPPGSYQNLDSLESRAENAIATRLGLYPLTTDQHTNFPLGGQVLSLVRMKGLSASYRYASATNGQIYRHAGDSQGQFTSIASGLGVSRLSMAAYRPAGSSFPYMFIAGTGDMVKDNGSFSAAQNWGIQPPLQPTTIAPFLIQHNPLNTFDSGGLAFTKTNITGGVTQYRVSGALVGPFAGSGIVEVAVRNIGIVAFSRAANVMTITCSPSHGLQTNVRVNVQGLSDKAGNVTSAVITVLNATQFTYANTGANNSGSGGGSDIGVCSPAPSFQIGMILNINDSAPESVIITDIIQDFSTSLGFSTIGLQFYCFNSHPNLPQGVPVFSQCFVGNVAANTIGTLSGTGPFNILAIAPAAPSVSPNSPDQDVINLFVYASNPLAIKEIKLYLDVGDGSGKQDYYYKSITPTDWTPAAAGTLPTPVVQSRRVFNRAAGVVDVRQLGVTNPSLLPTDLPDLQALQPAQLNAGNAAWTLVTVRLDELNQVGAAGTAQNDLTNVYGWRITFETQPTLSTTIGVDDLYAAGGSGLDSFAGQPYDYRITYYNAITGCESSPSVEMVSANFLAVQRSPIAVSFVTSADPQVTHTRVYRRGGTLTQAWYLVSARPNLNPGVSTPQDFLDTYSDAVILLNPTLVIDADPPVTTLLQSPLNAAITTTAVGPGASNVITNQNYLSFKVGQLLTIGTGGTVEQARVIGAFAPNVVQVYLQYAHAIGESITATTSPSTSMNLFAIAFDQAFFAGDPNNPHILYYSLTYNPETVPQANFIEVGTPDAPIMALVVLRGFLYVFTTKTVYQIFGGQGSVPVAIPTGVMHGLISQFAWAASENVVYYASYDGIYAFQGSGSIYMTQPTEWIWTGKNLGPIPAMDTTKKNQTIMAYANHELFVSYVDQNNRRHRQIWHDQYQRWRNDTASVGNITAMNFEQDTGFFVVGKDDGMIYYDRVNDYDSGGYSGGVEIKNPINFTLQTAQLDQGVQKAPKVYNELTIDATLNGNTVAVSLVFDSGNTIIPVGTISGTARDQYQINVQRGEGYESLNVGLLITGSTLSLCTFHELHIRALVEAEMRQGFDTYWLRFGTDEYKICKQGYFEYQAPNGAITVNVYAEGDMSSPVYTFTLPQSRDRISKRVRFPARKRKLWRLIGTSPGPVQMYMPESMLEVKSVSAQKGYERIKLLA